MIIKAQTGHKSVEQTWDHIKDIVEANDRLKQLEKGVLTECKVNAIKNPTSAKIVGF